MSKKAKEELNFYFLNEKDKIKESNKKDRAELHSAPKKKKTRKKQQDHKKDELFNFDNEIVIGVTKLPIEKDKIKNKAKKDNKKNKDKSKKNQNIKKKNNKKKQKKEKRNKIILNFIKWFFLIGALIGSIIFFMLSPLFNIQTINVLNNDKISTEKILSLAGIELGENTYKINKKLIKDNVKQNAYIESISITRKLPNILNIIVKEREATYMLEIGAGYAYINNQGYILEINSQKINTPIITGITTIVEDVKEGNRLYVQDLEKLGKVLEIYESAATNQINDLITKIDISNKQDYILLLEQEQKKVHLGDCSDIDTRILYLKKILELEKGKSGEVFINGDLSKDRVFFRENI